MENPEIKPGWIAPGGHYKLADPVELGWLPVEAENIEVKPKDNDPEQEQ